MSEMWKGEMGLLFICVYVVYFIYYFHFIILENSTWRWGWKNWKVKKLRLTQNWQRKRSSVYEVYLIPAASYPTDWVAARELHLQTSNSTAAVVKPTSHCEHNIKQNSSCRVALIHMLLPTFPGGLCWQLRLTQKQKQISNSCFAQAFQEIGHRRKVHIRLPR